MVFFPMQQFKKKNQKKMPVSSTVLIVGALSLAVIVGVVVVYKISQKGGSPGHAVCDRTGCREEDCNTA